MVMLARSSRFPFADVPVPLRPPSSPSSSVPPHPTPPPTPTQPKPNRPRSDGDKPEFKDFLPLPKPAHLVYIKPTVAVVTDYASRSSVGIKMSIGDNNLERYVVEYYSKKL